MELEKLRNLLTGLKEDDLTKLTDDELKELRKQLYHLWDNGIKLRDELDLSLDELHYRSHKRAISYSNDEIIGFVIDSCFNEGLREKVIDKKVSQNEAISIIKETLNNSGGTLLDSDKFSIGMKFYNAQGVDIKLHNSEYEKRDNDNSIESIVRAVEDYRTVTVTYSELYKRAFRKLRKSIFPSKPIEIKFVETPIYTPSIELLMVEDGQLALF